MSWRDVKAEAKRVVHETMHYSALYLPDFPLDSASAEPIPCLVRIHTSAKALGDQAGTSLRYAERTEFTPRIIFDLAEVDPERLAVVSVAAGEAYRVQVPEPPDGRYVTAEVTRLSADEAAGLPLPGA